MKNNSKIDPDILTLMKALCPDDPTAMSLEKALDKFHELFTESRLKGEYLEELFVKVLRTNGVDAEWNAGSHSVSTDIIIPAFNKKNISVKSGVYDVNGNFTFSGPRLGKHFDQLARLLHLKENSSDLYLCLAGPKKVGKRKVTGADPYHLVIFASSDVNYGTVKDWKKTAGGMAKIDESVIKATMTRSMSYQVWTTIKNIKEFAQYAVVR